MKKWKKKAKFQKKKQNKDQKSEHGVRSLCSDFAYHR